MSGRRQSRRDPVLDVSENQLLWVTCIALLCLSVLALIGVFTLTVVAPEAFGDTTTTTTTTVFVTPAPTPPLLLIDTCTGLTNIAESKQVQTRVCANSLPGTCSRDIQQRCDVTQAVLGDIPLLFNFQTERVSCDFLACAGDPEAPCTCPLANSQRFCQRDVGVDFPNFIAFPCRAARTCATFRNVDLDAQAPCTLGLEVEGGFCASDGDICEYPLIVGGTTDDVDFDSRSCELQECTPLSPCTCPDLVCTRLADNGALFTFGCA